MSSSSLHDASLPTPPDPKDDDAPSQRPPRPDTAQKKRRRPALSCEQCRRRKIKCDRAQPCVHCIKSGITDCAYAPPHIPASRAKKAASDGDKQEVVARRATPLVPRPTAVPTSLEEQGKLRHSKSTENIDQRFWLATAPGTPRLNNQSSLAPGTTSTPTNKVNWLVARIHVLEEKLENATLLSDGEKGREEEAEGETSQKELQFDDNAFNENARGTLSKTRYFGRSHWMNGTTLLPTELGLLGRGKHQQTGHWLALSQCKTLARIIKKHRFQPLSMENLGNQIPSRQLADVLVDAYLRTFEGIFRIVHIPTFRAEYEKYWRDPANVSDYFPIQLQLCMALGAPFYDEKFELRAQATRWVYEAQLWLMMPPEKEKTTIAGLQIMCLLTLARSVCGVGQDMVWITAGGLLRTAMFMGLHRDPRVLRDMSVYRAEMRRRLWATILELNLQTSFDAGGGALISPHDYDTAPPANLDDEELTDKPDKHSASSARPETITTRMAVPLALFKSFIPRLAALRHANDFRANNSYDETLRLNSELTKACRILSRHLEIHISSTSPYKPNSFHTSMAELFLYRCFHTLHQPVIARSLDDPKFYFSRKMYFESGLKVAHVIGLSGPNRTFRSADEAGNISTDLYRLLTHGSGSIRDIPVQTAFAVMLELLYKRNDQGLGLGYLQTMADYDLRATLEACQTWALRRIQSGETNIKGYCYLSAAASHVDALEAGLDQAGIEAAIVRGAEIAGARVLAELKAFARRQGIPVEEYEQMAGGENKTVPDFQEAPEEEIMLSMDWMTDWQIDDVLSIPWDHQPFMMPYISQENPQAQPGHTG